MRCECACVFVNVATCDWNLSTFWISYLDIVVEILLGLKRQGWEWNLDLYLSAIHKIISWCFTYDRINYARTGTMHSNQVNMYRYACRYICLNLEFKFVNITDFIFLLGVPCAFLCWLITAISEATHVCALQTIQQTNARRQFACREHLLDSKSKTASGTGEPLIQSITIVWFLQILAW